MYRTHPITVCALVFLTSGCFDALPDASAPCTVDSECPSGQTCCPLSNGSRYCVSSPAACFAVTDGDTLGSDLPDTAPPDSDLPESETDGFTSEVDEELPFDVDDADGSDRQDVPDVPDPPDTGDTEDALDAVDTPDLEIETDTADAADIMEVSNPDDADAAEDSKDVPDICAEVTCCTSDAECDDDNACTDDECVGSVCVNTNNAAVCGATSCSNSSLVPERFCSDGVCPEPAPAPCPGNLTCKSPSQCFVGCVNSSQCVSEHYCFNGSCYAWEADGTACETADACIHECIGGYCCDPDDESTCCDDSDCSAPTCKTATCLLGSGTCETSNAENFSACETDGVCFDGKCSDPIPDDMVFVPGATFMMGTDDDDAPDDEKPAHPVSVPGFWMHKREVTTAQFLPLLNEPGRNNVCSTDAGSGPCVLPHPIDGPVLDTTQVMYPNGQWLAAPACQQSANSEAVFSCDAHPVRTVSWFGASEWCAALGARLPTEAEWELAARGAAGRPFPWGEPCPAVWSPDPLLAGCMDDGPPRANCIESKTISNEDYCVDGWVETAPAASFSAGATPEGIVHLAGNVWEWVEDCHDDTGYGGAPDDGTAVVVPGCAYRVARGGSFDSFGRSLRATERSPLQPEETASGQGFRCVWRP